MKRYAYVFFSLLVLMTFSLSEAKAETPMSVEDRARMGEIYSLERMKKYDQAKPMIQKLEQKYPDNREVKWTYVRILGFSKDWKNATKIYEQLCPDVKSCDAEMIETYGHILEAQGPNPETLMYMKKLVDQHPEVAKLFGIYEEILSWNTQSAEGRQTLENLHKQFPNDKKIIEALGDAAFFAKDYPSAEQLYSQIMEGGDAKLHKKYMDSLLAQKKYTEAVQEMDRLLSQDPKNQDLRFAHAQILSATGKHEEAVKELKDLINEGFKKKEAVLMLGDELRQMGKNDEALKVYQEVTNEK